MAELVTTARCRTCPWTVTGGQEADSAAEKHVKAGHPVVTVTVPQSEENVR